MNVKARLSRSNLNLNHKQTPHFHRSYNNLNAIEQQYTPPRPPALLEPQYEQQQQQISEQQQQQNQWFHNNYNNNNNNNWNKYNTYETPNFVPASFWMGSERFVYPSMKPDSTTAATWQPQQEQQQHSVLQRGNILDYKNQSNTIYSVYNQNGKRHKATTNATSNGGTNVVTTTIQPMIKVRTNVQGLPYTPQPARRNTVTVNEQRAIQAVMPLNDILTNRGQQTS